MKTQTILLLDQQKDANVKRLKDLFASTTGDTQIHQLFNQEEFEGYLNQCKEAGSPFRTPSPTLIIIDIDFPSTDDGLAVLDAIAKSSLLGNIPLLIFTNNSDKAVIANCYVKGANGYYLKPTVDADITNALHALKLKWQRLSQRGFGYSYKAV